jgi:hypothetical protein
MTMSCGALKSGKFLKDWIFPVSGNPVSQAESASPVPKFLKY